MPDYVERSSLNYENLSKKYTNQSADYKKQYYNIYLKRLTRMSDYLKPKIEEKWRGKYPIVKLHKIGEEKPGKCVIIGTLFKNQKLKPSVLKQLAESSRLVPQPINTCYTDQSDLLYIEDELQRYQLIGALRGDHLVTGITCALLGNQGSSGKFEVIDHIFAGFPTQIERPLINQDIYIIFLSGLDFVNIEKIQVNLNLLKYFILGFSNISLELSKICRVIIAGNSIKKINNEIQKETISLISKATVSNETIEAVKLFDSFLLNLGKYVDIDIMPGENDPTNHILPQKSMHFCMFSLSSNYQSINQVTNPYEFSLGGIKFLGNSGQSVRDILRYSEITDPITAMENCLRWSHSAPTAPDTLGCFPFYNDDPFIIDECPHIFFSGNQPEFATKIVEGERNQKVTLISIPEFSNTQQACLLNLNDMSCYCINFNLK